MMFTDIVNSSGIMVAMPGKTTEQRDAAYIGVIKVPHDRIIHACMRSFMGRAIKELGDGFLCVFNDAEKAVLCGLQILHTLADQPLETPLGALQIRIGINTGIAHRFKGDFRGTSVNKAAWVQRYAAPGQLAISGETRAIVMGKIRDVQIRNLGVFHLKTSGKEEIYAVSSMTH